MLQKPSQLVRQALFLLLQRDAIFREPANILRLPFALWFKSLTDVGFRGLLAVKKQKTSAAVAVAAASVAAAASEGAP